MKLISLNRTSFLYKDRTCKVDKWFFNVDSFKLLCKISSRMKTRKEEDVDVEEASSRKTVIRLSLLQLISLQLHNIVLKIQV